MTYALASALQQSVFKHLTADAGVTAALGSLVCQSTRTKYNGRSWRGVHPPSCGRGSSHLW